MDEEIKKLLDEEIESQIQGLADLKNGSEEKSKAIDDLVQLYKLRIEESKNDKDVEEKRERRLMEQEQTELVKSTELSEQKKERYIKIGLTAAELLIPLVFYGRWMKKGFKFEETGTFTSTTFRGLFNRFRPTK